MDWKKFILNKLKKREIYRRSGQPYLTRYYVFKKPVPWLPSIYIHQFHSSDEDPELHNHPWKSSVSFILKGAYMEHYRKGDTVFRRSLTPGNLNWIKSDTFHRVDLITPTVWTLFVSGRKIDSWGFWSPITKEYWDWTEHIQRKFKPFFTDRQPIVRTN